MAERINRRDVSGLQEARANTSVRRKLQDRMRDAPGLLTRRASSVLGLHRVAGTS
jgi:hypothetical protein